MSESFAFSIQRMNIRSVRMKTLGANRELQGTIESVPTSDGAGDYIAGFPSHPHRGFETVTYMLDGHMRHEDHLGHRGELTSGGVQWMTAGRGIIHSEMPQQDRGRMRGFQLWINLPAREKMKPAGYRDLQATDIPEVSLPGGGLVRVIAGQFGETVGPITGLATEPVYFD